MQYDGKAESVKRAPGRLLIYAPVPLYRMGQDLWLEDQASNGMRLWAEHFSHVTAMMPLETGAPPPTYQPVAKIGQALERIGFVPLPVAWRPGRFLRTLPSTRATIRDEIAKADYLSFAIGGLFGDWGAVACHEAHRMGRPYAVWADRVESAVTRRAAHDAATPKAWLRAVLTHRPMAALERWVIRRAALGLFHGRETFTAYAPFCANSHIVHDVHVCRADHIAPDALADKLARAGKGPLNILYVGRADAMKGPMDWIKALEKLAARRVDFRARWIGEGAQIDALRQRIVAAGLSDRVSAPGFLVDRQAIYTALRQADVLLFCHKTPESPRVLIESLVSGTPIIGYRGDFAEELTEAHGGGVLVPLDDVDALSDALAKVAGDPARLAALMQAAAADGAVFTDESVFAHRSQIIRAHLPPRS